MSALATPEPAIKSYFFGKGYRDLWATIRDSWQSNIKSANDFFAKAPGGSGAGEMFESGFWITAGVSTVVFGTLLFLVASAAHILLLGTLFSLIYIAFSILWLIERIYLGIRAYFMACPSCHAKRTIPEYHCDNCLAVHSRLIPNSYGILSHRCQCGQRLPSTFFLNRGRLQACCPVCHEPLEREHVESKRLFVPVMGGPATGKSAFLFSALRQFMDVEAARRGVTATLLDKSSQDAYDAAVGALRSGRTPDKTLANVPRALNVRLERDGNLARVLYLYDPAGESFQDTNALLAHGFHKYLSGMVLLIDPFSIPSVRSHYEAISRIDVGRLQPSADRIDDALEGLLLVLESDFGLARGARVKSPLAVVVTKIDAFDLDSRIGALAMKSACATVPTKDPNEVRNQLIRTQLIDWGEEAFVHAVDARFTRVSYFASSALGRLPDGSGLEYVGRGVLEPLLWVLESADPSGFGAV